MQVFQSLWQRSFCTALYRSLAPRERLQPSKIVLAWIIHSLQHTIFFFLNNKVRIFAWMFLVLESLLHLFLSNWVPADIPQPKSIKKCLEKVRLVHNFLSFFSWNTCKWLDLLNVYIWQNCIKIISDRSNSVAVLANTDRYISLRFYWNTIEKFQSFFTFPQVGQAKAMSKIKAWSSHIIRHFWYCSKVCKVSSTTPDEEALKMKVCTHYAFNVQYSYLHCMRGAEDFKCYWSL